MNSPAPGLNRDGSLKRLRFEARGLVQGVGFRPHALRTARELNLAGLVRNHGDGVTIEVEGRRAQDFEACFRSGMPPLARLDSLTHEELPAAGDREFIIEKSSAVSGDAIVPADTAVCGQCIEELFDRKNRRYKHPFIACSDCGPRYTMTRELPYDRANTTMADFAMCDCCTAEYTDEVGRRLHAEPIGCHDCGPELSTSIQEIAESLRDGGIVALKGIGGYHLACDARNPEAIRRLRVRKRRDGRPFAVMMLNAASAAGPLVLSKEQQELLASPQRPVLIAERSNSFDLPDALAPGLSTLGVILPYTALHYLLFHALAGDPEGHAWLQDISDLALVMTSANRSGEPILTSDEEARTALADIADLVVSHNRDIARGCEDSVVRSAPGRTIMLRRGRGYAPAAIDLGEEQAEVLALGAQLKNTFCITRGSEAYLSPHLGDLESAAMHRLLDSSARDLLEWLHTEPTAIACDLHPDYASTRIGEHLATELDVPLFCVQHHHAHIASVLAASGHEGPALGLALDGHGLGTDGVSWGGELLRVDGGAMTRLGHLRELPLPGGDRATREPWRLALAVADTFGRSQALALNEEQNTLREGISMLARSSACARSTACGRYFDAAAALLGLCHTATFEAEAPMRLESHCRDLRQDRGLYSITDGVLDLYPLLCRMLDADSPEHGAGLFHGTLIAALSQWVADATEASGIRSVVLSGGCYLNATLATQLPARLQAHGLKVMTEWDRLTPGDGSISLGQAWVAGRMLGHDRKQNPHVESMRGVS